jgi:hypothetical protein
LDLRSQHAPDRQHDADILPVDFRGGAPDCGHIQRTVYEVQQRFHYSYTAPICNLRQRLVVVPRLVHGNQRALCHRLEMSERHSRRRMRADRFGNCGRAVGVDLVTAFRAEQRPLGGVQVAAGAAKRVRLWV